MIRVDAAAAAENMVVLDPVVRWRLHVLIGAGCSLPCAERLAITDHDLHQLVWMLECECPEETICRIVF